jgi:phosphate-selective porin OprO and OprP
MATWQKIRILASTLMVGACFLTIGTSLGTQVTGNSQDAGDAMELVQPFTSAQFGTVGIVVSVEPTPSRVQERAANDASVAFDDEATLNSRLRELENRAAASDAKILALERGAKKSESDAAKLPNLKFHGAFQADGVGFTQDDASREAYGRIESGADFRRARLGAQGAITDRMDYFFQMDFGFFGRPTFTDLWVDFKDLGPLGTLRVGQWKHPFSLEAVSSYRYTTFMERAGTFQAFVPFRHIGLGLYDHTEDLMSTWAVSYLRTGQDQFAGSLSTDGGNGIASRVTHLMWYGGQDGSEFLHLGLGYFLNSPPNGRIRVRSIPEIFVGEFSSLPGDSQGSSGVPVSTVIHGTPFFVDTGRLRDVRMLHTYGTEALLVHGPVSWQTEVMGQHLETASVGNAFLWGGYTQVGVFLTGEHRPYDRRAAAIDRVKPVRPVTKVGGIGAWEVAVRWSYVDLLDQQIRGGDMENVTFGVNWYVNAYCKCVFNYIQIDATSRKTREAVIVGDELIASTTEAYGLRLQVDF